MKRIFVAALLLMAFAANVMAAPVPVVKNLVFRTTDIDASATGVAGEGDWRDSSSVTWAAINTADTTAPFRMFPEMMPWPGWGPDSYATGDDSLTFFVLSVFPTVEEAGGHTETGDSIYVSLEVSANGIDWFPVFRHAPEVERGGADTFIRAFRSYADTLGGLSVGQDIDSDPLPNVFIGWKMGRFILENDAAGPGTFGNFSAMLKYYTSKPSTDRYNISEIEPHLQPLTWRRQDTDGVANEDFDEFGVLTMLGTCDANRCTDTTQAIALFTEMQPWPGWSAQDDLSGNILVSVFNFFPTASGSTGDTLWVTTQVSENGKNWANVSADFEIHEAGETNSFWWPEAYNFTGTLDANSWWGWRLKRYIVTGDMVGSFAGDVQYYRQK